MIATVDLGSAQSVQTVRMHFLDDPRHWIFLPEKLKVEVSIDGSKYQTISEVSAGAGDEHYELSIKEFTAQNKGAQVRYIRVTAANGTTLPLWRFKEGKKPMIACSEVWVE